jgi:hypothetical protein
MLDAWARRWGVPAAALAELHRELGALGATDAEVVRGSEAGVQSHVRLNASRMGWRLWRNNVGAFQAETGAWVRYGLCNESKRVNACLKSSDLIGIRPVLITPEHMGQTIGQFVAIETKAPGWKLTPGDKRGQAQQAFGLLVKSLGGFFRFVNSTNDI